MLTPIEYLTEFNQIGLFNHLSSNDYDTLQERFTSYQVTEAFTTLSPSEQINLKNSVVSSEANLSDILPIWVLREVKDCILYLRDWKKPIYQLDDYKAFLIKLQSISHNQFDIDNIKVAFFELDEASKAMMGKHTASTALEISFRFGGKKYSDFTFFHEGKVGEGFASYRLIDIANEALVKAEIDGRFCSLLAKDDYVANAGPYLTWAYIFLSYNQFKEVTRKQFLKLNADQKFTWSSTRILDVISTLKELGLLAYLENKQILKIQRRLLQRKDPSYPDILNAFPNLVLHIDSEMIYDVPEDYTELIVETSKVSRGIFNPTNIQVTDADINNPEFSITFEYNNRIYSKTIEYRGDWVNYDYLVLINEALADAKKMGRFCLVETRDQTAVIIFLTDNQFKRVQENNLLPLTEWQP